jgi:hypothetical protein
VNDLRIPPYSLDVSELKQAQPYMEKVDMKSMKNVRPSLLIGIDNGKLTGHREILEGKDYEPIATMTKLGWAIGGVKFSPGRQTSHQIFHICEKTMQDDELHHLVKDFFSTEVFGVKVREGKPKSRQDERALRILDSTTRRIDGDRWETGLLWKKYDVSLPPSRQQAVNRLRCQERKMDRDEEFAKLHCAKIMEYE